MPRFIGQNPQGQATIAPAGRAAGFGASQLGGAALGLGLGPLSFFGGAGISALLMSMMGQMVPAEERARRANSLFQMAQGLAPGQGGAEGQDLRGGRRGDSLRNAFNAQAGGRGDLLNPAFQGVGDAFRFSQRHQRLVPQRNSQFISGFADQFAGNPRAADRLRSSFGLQTSAGKRQAARGGGR